MAHTLGLLKNQIQHYAWGSTTAIPELLGESNPEQKPMAELWMGAHSKAPSMLAEEQGTQPLDEAIAQDPPAMLGPEIARQFEGRLPFLFKILAAAKPLSLQTHPNLEQARDGFAREEQAGIPIGSPNRSYRDRNHKPELLCALTPFSVMCGFRPINEILNLLEPLHLDSLNERAQVLRHEPANDALRQFFTDLMSLPPQEKPPLVAQVVEKAQSLVERDPAFSWIGTLNAAFPGDIGVLCPLVMNVGRLMPGEAIYLDAGVLHAYLQGVGVEIMANSDNVLRGALTSKHVDLPELLKVLRYAPRPLDVLEPVKRAAGEEVYSTPAREFELSVLRVDENGAGHCGGRGRVEMLFCATGSAKIHAAGQEKTWEFKRGQSIFVPADVEECLIEGRAEIFRASVP